MTRHKKFIVGSILKLQNKMVNMRLLWTLQNIPELVEALKNDKNSVMFGTLECWLLYKLSGDKKTHMSTSSNAAATGMFHKHLKYSSSQEITTHLPPDDSFAPHTHLPPDTIASYTFAF